eukprot:TRINITY_DN15380_c0_g1_i3.p1 TRINITY_DN15380_c0_g1~~TRINITY_DN15380_c0_g1_i3.p1  ORF type:complete len:121 (-),score=13.08 TRINITY_DN15380_c0_g1_i3:72-434(-)
MSAVKYPDLVEAYAASLGPRSRSLKTTFPSSPVVRRARSRPTPGPQLVPPPHGMPHGERSDWMVWAPSYSPVWKERRTVSMSYSLPSLELRRLRETDKWNRLDDMDKVRATRELSQFGYR